MFIHEAIVQALATKSHIARTSDSSVTYEPTNTSMGIIIFDEGMEPGECWAPNANDLIAIDWYAIPR